MGVWYSSDYNVSNFYKISFGYPRCTDSSAPSGCVEGTMWGHYYCATGSFFSPRNGWNQNFWNGCDVSPAHSGSPIYSYSPGSQGPYILATEVGEFCSGSSCGGMAAPNYAFRIDQGLGDAMMYWRSVH
jgi:hypothetical protein